MSGQEIFILLLMVLLLQARLVLLQLLHFLLLLLVLLVLLLLGRLLPLPLVLLLVGSKLLQVCMTLLQDHAGQQQLLRGAEMIGHSLESCSWKLQEG